MKVGLDSDFRDYYDHWFDIGEVGYQLVRQTQDYISKRKQFQMLEEMGFTTPRHGIVGETSWCSDWLVVYEDEFAHAGKGKVLYQTSLARQKVPHLFASEFIESNEEKPLLESTSTRFLVLGFRYFLYEYHSSNSWMSNTGEVKFDNFREVKDFYRYFSTTVDIMLPGQFPIFAIDLVKRWDTSEFYAVDFNSAPGLKGTPVEDNIPAKEVFKAIKGFVDYL